MTRRAKAPILLLAMTACSGPVELRPPAPAPAPGSARPAAQAPTVEVAADPIESPLSPEDQEARKNALAALDAGDGDGAAKILAGVVARNPGNATNVALLDAARRVARERQVGASVALAKKEPIAIGGFPSGYTLEKPVPTGATRVPKLRKLSEAKRYGPGIIHPEPPPKLAMLDVRNAPQVTPTSYREFALGRGFIQEGHTVLVFTNRLRRTSEFLTVVDASGAAGPVFDVTEAAENSARDGFRFLPTVSWAERRDGALFLSTGNRYTHAPRSGFLTAVDPETGKLFWRSDPNVSNATNFVVYGGAIFAAYGAETKNQVVVLDESTGKVAASYPVSTQAYLLALHDKRLTVLTSDTKVEFAIVD